MTRKILYISIVLGALAGMPEAMAQDGHEDNSAEKSRGRSAQLTLDDLRTFTDVFNQARRNYVEEVEDKTLLDAAISGMLSQLDPHSSYLPKEELEDLNDAARGQYRGIGVDVQARHQKIVVNAIITDSPADRAGLNPGDVIVSIDGEPVKGRYLPEAMDELLGEPGTDVVLVVVPPEGEERELTITREYIRVPTLSFELLDPPYGYFKITQFHRESVVQLEYTLDSIAADGIEMDGVIIDLRNNPGGVLQQAVELADGFLDEGVIVTTRGRNASMQMEFSAQEGQWLPTVPVMILVDRGTASASEVFAGAMQDHDRAVIVGEQTFGKGSVQSVLPLRNGAGIKLTTARYYTPSGRSIQAEGIRPDIEIDWGASADSPDLRQREADLDRHLGSETDINQAADDAGHLLDGFPLQEMLGALREAGIIEDENEES